MAFSYFVSKAQHLQYRRREMLTPQTRLVNRVPDVYFTDRELKGPHKCIPGTRDSGSTLLAGLVVQI